MAEIANPNGGHGEAADMAPAPAAAAERDSDAELANAIGINRRTVYKLRHRGAPASRDESAWRAWCASQCIRIRAPLVVDLGVDDPRGTIQNPGDVPPPADAATTTATGLQARPADGWSPPAMKNLRDAELKELQAKKVRMEIAALERDLVARADVVRLAGALAAIYVHELLDLPSQAVRTLDALPVEWKRPVRKAVEQAIDGLRGRLSASLREKLGSVLAGSAGGSHGR